MNYELLSYNINGYIAISYSCECAYTILIIRTVTEIIEEYEYHCTYHWGFVLNHLKL
jgi:hypothetical protein